MSDQRGKVLSPKLSGVRLEACCRKELKKIKLKLETGRQTKKWLASIPFILILGRPKSALLTVVLADWDKFDRGLSSIDRIVRDRCRLIAGLHMLKHRTSALKLRRFWRALHTHFV